MRTIASGLRPGLSLAVMGLAAGLIAGWVSLILADGPENVARIGARFYLVLTVALPVFTALMISYDVTQNRQRYTSVISALVHLLVIGTFGAASATLMFIVGAGQIPAIFGGESAADVTVALYPEIGWTKFIAVFAITVASALIMAMWAHLKTRRS